LASSLRAAMAAARSYSSADPGTGSSEDQAEGVGDPRGGEAWPSLRVSRWFSMELLWFGDN